ncbi:ISL3 family transposase, partial [Nonomuraea turkmeniaca]
MEKVVGAHYGCVKSAYANLPGNREEPAAPPKQPDGYLDVNGRERALVTRQTSRYLETQELVAQGRSLKSISRELNLNYYAVRRYARADSLEEVLAKAVNRPTLLDAYKPYLYEQFAVGCHNASQLFRQIQEQGYGGSLGPVDRYIRLLRKGAAPPPPVSYKPLRAHETLRHL